MELERKLAEYIVRLRAADFVSFMVRNMILNIGMVTIPALEKRRKKTLCLVPELN